MKDEGILFMDELPIAKKKKQKAINKLLLERALTPPSKKTKKLDEFYWHEALDRAYMALDQFERMVLDHPVVQANDELCKMADDACDKMLNLYQRVADLDPHWEKRNARK